jgi:hypothetical protein
MRTPALLALLLALAAPAAAQTTVLPVVGVGSIGQPHVTVLGGARFSHTPVPGIRRDASGRVVPVAAAPTFEVVAQAGATFAHGAYFTATGQAAYLFPRGTGALSLWGPVVFGAYRPDAIGAGARVETSFRAAGLTAGPVWTRYRRGPRLAVMLDVSVPFLFDLVSKGAPPAQ